MIANASANEISVRGFRSDLPSEKPERSTSTCAGDSFFTRLIGAGQFVGSVVDHMLLRCSSLEFCYDRDERTFFIFFFPSG